MMITKLGTKLYYDYDTPEATTSRRDWLKRHNIKGDIGIDVDDVYHYPKGMTDQDKMNWYGFQRYGTDDWRPLHEKAEAKRLQRRRALEAQLDQELRSAQQRAALAHKYPMMYLAMNKK